MIRPAAPADHPAIRAVNTAAFPTPAEADLVEALRNGGHAIAELVAENAGQIVGHILFTWLDLIGPDSDCLRGAALAPMAVHPDRQRQGVGGRLIAAGVGDCRAAGVAAIVVLGHADYYPRHGFTPAAGRIEDPFAADAAFMVLELVEGALDRPRRPVYAAPFGVI